MRFRLNHKIGSIAFMCVCMAWMVLGCQEDKYILEQSADKIDFQITSDREMVSRSSSDVSFHINGQELSLVWSVEENTDSIQVNEEVESRGAAFENKNKQIHSIYTTAIYPINGGGKDYFKDEKIDINNQKGTSGHFWPEESLSFFAYAFSDNRQYDAPVFYRENNICSGSFSYALPEASEDKDPKDATAQPDVVFAITPNWTKDQDKGQVSLQFHHALSAIVFKVGNMPSDIKLESIAISGVYDSGSCTMKEANSQDKDLDVQFSWAYTDEQAQTFAYTENLGSESPKTGSQMGGSEAIFMMLPQKISEDTKLIFTFSVGGKTYVMNKNFKDIGVEKWDADHKYTFTIGLPDDIDVEVEDMVEEGGLVKTEVTIQNTGIVTGYIRAAIVGYWKNADGVIEAPWSPESDGKFENLNDTEWEKGEDGFYYHKNPVGGNQFTAKLFDTYTLDSDVAESNKNKGLTLELSIVAQIIPEDVWSELNDSSN